MRRYCDRVSGAEYRSRVRGCLLGGAIGDALGHPVEFWSADVILREYGQPGVRDFQGGGSPAPGLITDDTQMTLFTVQGLIRAGIRRDRGLGLTLGVVHEAYDHWLDTQRLSQPPPGAVGPLGRAGWLYAQRAPGTTCLGALGTARGGGERIRQYGGQATNNSKGCGGVMRVAPIGLLPPSIVTADWCFDAGATAAGYTHGHPTGKLPAGVLAQVVHHLVAGEDLNAALDAAMVTLATHESHEETTEALLAARRLAARGEPTVAAVESLGGGWVAEEALAIAVYAALCHPDSMLDALSVAVTHGGDSDSTGAICGNILGAWHGEDALPPQLLFRVEGRATIAELADDLVLEFTASQRLHGDHGPDTGWRERYG